MPAPLQHDPNFKPYIPSPPPMKKQPQMLYTAGGDLIKTNANGYEHILRNPNGKVEPMSKEL